MVNEVPEKILEIPGEGGVIKDSPGTENPGGWGVQIKESSMGGGGMDIFWNHTLRFFFFLTTEVFTCSKVINAFKR